MTEYELPVGEGFSEAEVANSFLLMEDTPYENPALAYKILVPFGFEAQDIRAETDELSTSMLKPLAVFKGLEAGGVNPMVQIQAVKLVRDISAANWLRYYSFLTGREILAIRPVSPQFADSLMKFQIEGVPFFARATATIDGDRLFFLFCLSTEEEYENFKREFGICAISFNLQQKSSRQTVERRVSESLGDVVQFHYPESWKPVEIPSSPEGKLGMDLLNFNPEGHLAGKIRVKTVAKSVTSGGIDQQIEDTFDEYRESNVEPKGILETINAEIGVPRFEVAIINAYKAEIQGNEMVQEIWVAVIETSEYYIIVSLLTPFREEEFFFWAVNRRAYDIVLGTLA